VKGLKHSSSRLISGVAWVLKRWTKARAFSNDILPCTEYTLGSSIPILGIAERVWAEVEIKYGSWFSWAVWIFSRFDKESEFSLNFCSLCIVMRERKPDSDTRYNLMSVYCCSLYARRPFRAELWTRRTLQCPVPRPVKQWESARHSVPRKPYLSMAPVLRSCGHFVLKLFYWCMAIHFAFDVT